MKCAKILEKVYDHYGDPRGSLLTQIQVDFHVLFCPACAREIRRLEVCRDILTNDFMPRAPGLEDSVMAIIAKSTENGRAPLPETVQAETPGGFSTKGWVIAGLVMLISLATVFFGLEFNKIALAAGISFLIPIGITIGAALTCYGALFIGSHLKELTERFGL